MWLTPVIAIVGDLYMYLKWTTTFASKRTQVIISVPFLKLYLLMTVLYQWRRREYFMTI